MKRDTHSETIDINNCAITYATWVVSGLPDISVTTRILKHMLGVSEEMIDVHFVLYS